MTVEGGRNTVIAMATIVVLLLLAFTLIPKNDVTGGSQDNNEVTKYKWEYKGKPYTWEIQIPSGLFEYYRDIPRDPDYAEYVKDPDDDRYLSLLCDKLSEADVKSDWTGKIDFVLSFVQSLKYANDSLTGFDEYPRYPIETLVEECGDCEDTSILFVSIVREMGYGSVLLRFDDSQHMAAGVSISEEVIANWPENYPLTYYESKGERYAYCETTGSGWRIGEKPDWVRDSGAAVIHLDPNNSNHGQ